MIKKYCDFCKSEMNPKNVTVEIEEKGFKYNLYIPAIRRYRMEKDKTGDRETCKVMDVCSKCFKKMLNKKETE